MAVMLKKAFVCLLVLIVILGAIFHVYYIRDTGNGTLYWNGDTAYLFLNLGSVGYRVTYLQFIGESILAIFQWVPHPSDKRFSSVVFTITSDDLRRSVNDDAPLGEYDIANGNIYARNLDTGKLWKWNYYQFELATGEDERTLSNRPDSPGSDYDDFAGWHKRCCFLYRGSEYNQVLNLNGAKLSIVSKRKDDDHSIDLVRPDGATETILHLDGNSRNVSESEYQHVFDKK
jgi:hypothetical protein